MLQNFRYRGLFCALRPICALGALLSTIIVGCAASSDPMSVEHEIAQLVASPSTVSELEVVTWKVLDGDNGIRIVGIGADNSMRIETLASPISEEEVKLDLLFPVTGSVWLHQNGTSVGATSDKEKRISAALYSDLRGQGKVLPTIPIQVEGEEIASAALALSIASEGHIDMPWSFFGYTVDEIVGDTSCNGTRNYYSAYPNTNASCWVTRWATDIPGDCRILLHRGIRGWYTDTCNWYVYKD